MKYYYLFILSAFLLFSPLFLSAQTFLNGSFESTTGNCSYNLLNSTFNSTISNCYGFGSASQIDIIDNSCGYGTAENGNVFLGIAVDNTNTLTDAFSLELSAPLVAGNSYVLSFYNRKDPGYGANLLEIGYSGIATSFGTAIDTIALPGTSWDFVSVTFTPTVNCSYITVQTIAGSYGWNFVDDFAISDITSTNDVVTENQSVQVYPNPTAGLISVVGSSDCGVETTTLKDIQGNTILVTQNNVIDMSGFSSGIYFLEMTTNKGTVVKRIVRD